MNQELHTRVLAFVARLKREDVNMHGFMLTVGETEKARASWAPFRIDAPHRLYSVSKTMVGIALGILMDEGKISLEDRIVSLFPDLTPENASPYLQKLKIRDMLRMATCYRQTAYREYVDADWTKPFFTGHPDHEPGTVFNYDTGNSQVLASLVRRVSGKEVIDFLEERLFTPLGCEDRRYWLRDPSGQCTGGTGLCMSLRDMNRVALCLSRGGDGLIPGWFVTEMQKKQIDTPLQGNEEEKYGYGWQCWRTRAGWSLYGMGGQLAVICPEKDTVLCTTADTRLDPCGVQRIYNAFFEEIYPYIGREDMLSAEMMFQAPPLPGGSPWKPAKPAAYEFPENPMGIRELRLEKDEMIIINRRGECRLPIRAGETVCAEYPGWPGEPATVSAAWFAENSLRIRCYATGDFPCGFDMVIAFGEDTVTVQSRRSNDPRTDDYDGTASGTRKA